MKKILFTIVLTTVFITHSFAQIMQASIGAGSNSQTVDVFLKTSTPIGAAFTSSTLQFDVAIPDIFAPIPTITLIRDSVNFPLIAASHWDITTAVEGGYRHFMILNTQQPLYSKLDGSETRIFQIRFSGSGSTNASLVTLPDGGSGPTNGSALFYCNSGTITSAGNNLYYARPGTTVFNGDSYRPSGNLGTQTSFATLGAPIVLPVKFTSFSATKKDNDAHLSWIVENETSLVANYEVERSIDGIKFDKINTISRNAAASNIYNITDPNLSALKNSGVIYYRIKQLDVNGAFVYSDIKNVRLTEKGTLITMFPNPVMDITTVKIDVIEAVDVTLSLLSADGKQLQTSTLKAAKGLNLKKIDMNNFAMGEYLLKVTIGTDVQTIKVVKL
jgi:hypothetical protein